MTYYNKEYHKQWYQDNRERILENKRQYDKDNREIVLERKRRYYQDNRENLNEVSKYYYQDHKEQIKEKAKEKIVCDCGGHFTYCSKSQHLKTKKHLNFIANNI